MTATFEAVVDAGARVEILLRHGAPLNVRNVYGGTVLGATYWAAANGVSIADAAGMTPVDHAPIIERRVATSGVGSAAP